MLAWIFQRVADPYVGVRRESTPDLWFGQIPESGGSEDRAVRISYRIRESSHTVVCDQIAELVLPI